MARRPSIAGAVCLQLLNIAFTSAALMPLTAETCSASSLGLPATHKPHAFLTTTCVLQEALGVSKPVCSQLPPSPPAKPHPFGQLADLLHNVSAIEHASNLTLASRLSEIRTTVHQDIREDVANGLAGLHPLRIPLPTPLPANDTNSNVTCHPDPPTFYTTNFVRNGSVGGEYAVTPPVLPPVPIQKRRSMAEQAAHLAGAQALDSTVTSGSVVTYTPYANGTLDGNNMYYAFYGAYQTQSVTTFRFPPGTYTVVNPVSGFHLVFQCDAGVRGPFTIDFGGATFIFTDGNQGGVFFNLCNSITATNGTFYYTFSQNPWYQATITGMANQGTVWNITVQDGYPTSFVTDVYQSLCVAWDPVTRLPRRNASDIYPGYGQTVALGGSNYQFNFGYVVQNVFTGDYITCRGDRGNHGIVPWYNQFSTFSYLTIYNAAIFGFYEETGRANTYTGNTVTPYPFAVGSGGAAQAPLQSSLADGFHASGAFVGPTLINNFFTNMGDDGIAIHGHYYLIVGVDQAASNITLAVICGYDCSRIYAGNTLQAYNGSTFYLGSTGVLANNVVPNPLAAGTTSATFPNANLAASVYINVTVACWPAGFSGLGFDDVVTSHDNQGDGFAVINNTVQYNRGRGILLKASNGVVAGNTFTEPKFIAAQITPEFYFQEADFSSNISVTGNTFASFYSGIVLGFISDGTGLPGAYQNHVNVTIANNLILNAADQPLLITSATGVTVTNNTFASVLCYPYTVGAAYGFVPNPQPPIYVADSSNLTFAGNKYVTPANCTYGAFANPIQYDPATVTGITITS